jgi:hypothetical protein
LRRQHLADLFGRACAHRVVEGADDVAGVDDRTIDVVVAGDHPDGRPRATGDVDQPIEPLGSLRVFGGLTAERDVAAYQDPIDWPSVADQSLDVQDQLLALIVIVVPRRPVAAEMDVAEMQQAKHWAVLAPYPRIRTHET